MYYVVYTAVKKSPYHTIEKLHHVFWSILCVCFLPDILCITYMSAHTSYSRSNVLTLKIHAKSRRNGDWVNSWCSLLLLPCNVHFSTCIWISWLPLGSSSSTCFGTEPPRINGTGFFYGADVLPATTQPSVSKHWQEHKARNLASGLASSFFHPPPVSWWKQSCAACARSPTPVPNLIWLAATLRGSRPGVQSASLIMTSLMTS